MKPKVISKTFSLGKQRWRLAGDKWSVLMYGSFRQNQTGLHWEWASISTNKVPKELLDCM